MNARQSRTALAILEDIKKIESRVERLHKGLGDQTFTLRYISAGYSW